MRSNQFAFLMFLFCSLVSGFAFGIESDAERAAAKRVIERAAETTKRTSAIAKMKPVTKAKILRDGSKIEIDFSEPDVAKKIQSGDVVELESGLYTNLGDISAADVIFKGQGPKKTFISTQPEGTKPILQNETEFWDLAIVDATFQSLGKYGLWAMDVEFAGKISVLPAAKEAQTFTVRTGLSDITYSSLSRTGWMDLDPVTREGSLNLLTRDTLTDRTDDDIENIIGWWHGMGIHVSINIAPKLMKIWKPRGLNVKDLGPTLFISVGSEFDNQNRLSISEIAALKNVAARLTYYRYQSDAGLHTSSFDQTRFDRAMALAEEADKKNLILLKLSLWTNADSSASFVRTPEIRKRARAALAKTNLDVGCKFVPPKKTGAVDYPAFKMRAKYLKSFPGLGLPGRCEIEVEEVSVAYKQEKAVEKRIGKRDVYGLTGEAHARISAQRQQEEMARVAADKARENAYKASINASTERMADNARKEEAGRLQVTGSGSNKVMTYGTGNFTGQATAGTVNQVNANNDEARRQQEIANAASASGVNAADIEKKGEVDKLESVVADKSTTYLQVTIRIPGQPVKILKGPQTTIFSRRICTYESGPFQAATCKWGEPSSVMDPKTGVNIEATLEPILKNRLATQGRKLISAAKGADPLTRLNNDMSTIIFEGSDKVKEADLRKLQEEALGTWHYTDTLINAAFVHL